MSHWYDQEGNPKYTIIGANGKERDTTLRDAKKLNLVPSVTTILQLIAKPALNIWLQNQVLDAAIDYAPPRRIQDQFEDGGWKDRVKQWKAIIIDKSQKIGRDSAKRGSEIHDELETYFLDPNSISQDNPNFDFISPIVCELHNRMPNYSWIPEKSFSSKLGFGGKVDLHSLIGSEIVLDFKTKSGTANFDKDLGYMEHAMQLAAYREGLDIPNAKCYNLFISTETPGLLQLKEWKEEEIQKAWKMFRCLLHYWQLLNNIEVNL